VAAESLPPRAGQPMPEQLREVISQALRLFLEGWLKKWLYDGNGSAERAVTVAAALDIPVESGRGGSVFGYIMD
jgi:hypothetical protein